MLIRCIAQKTRHAMSLHINAFFSYYFRSKQHKTNTLNISKHLKVVGVHTHFQNCKFKPQWHGTPAGLSSSASAAPVLIFKADTQSEKSKPWGNCEGVRRGPDGVVASFTTRNSSVTLWSGSICFCCHYLEKKGIPHRPRLVIMSKRKR